MSYVHFRREMRETDDEALCGAWPDKRLAEPPPMTGEKPEVTCWRCVMLLLGRPIPAEPETPEHERLEAAKHEGRDATQLVGEFLSWLDEEGIRLARYHEGEGELLEIHERKQALLAKFFGINENALESEKQALLDYQRKLNAAIEWAKSDGRDALQRA